MPTRIVCPQCKQAFTVDETKPGQGAYCPYCRKPLETVIRPTAPLSAVARRPATLPPIIDLRYEVRGTVGEGAFGIVYHAWDFEGTRDVAVKVLNDRALLNPDAVNRFLRESEVLSKIAHPNVVPVLGRGRDGHRYYIVFPLIRGRPVKEMIPPHGIADPSAAVRLIITLVKALHYVHKEHGILHRDIKPANMMVVEGDALYLMDFGLAACQDRAQTTVTGVIMGTPAYMSPEQAAGQARQVCHQSDLYGAGAVLFHLLTGTVPFSKPYPEIFYDIRNAPTPRPSARRAGLDPALDALVLKALEKEPKDRYQNGQEFADALQAWLDRPRQRGAPGKSVRSKDRDGKKPHPAPPAGSVDSVSVAAVSTVHPVVPTPRGPRPTTAGPGYPPWPAVPPRTEAPPEPRRSFLGLALLGLLWLTAAGFWALWAYHVYHPVIGERARRFAVAEEDTTPRALVFAAGAALVVSLLVWIGMTIRHCCARDENGV